MNILNKRCHNSQAAKIQQQIKDEEMSVKVVERSQQIELQKQVKCKLVQDSLK